MAESYYPRHSELERTEDLEVDALKARVALLEGLLREVVTDYVGWCESDCKPSCIGERARQALEATHA